jgi:hypothetical protein
LVWDHADDCFTLRYEKQSASACLKTHATEACTHAFALDTLRTDMLADPEIGTASGNLYHSWWVDLQHAADPFIANRLRIQLGTNESNARNAQIAIADQKESSGEESGSGGESSSGEESIDDVDKTNNQVVGRITRARSKRATNKNK